jgi:hypothetical protein
MKLLGIKRGVTEINIVLNILVYRVFPKFGFENKSKFFTIHKEEENNRKCPYERVQMEKLNTSNSKML